MRVGSSSKATQIGFTLIELLITIALIGIVSLIAIPNFQGIIASNRSASDFNEVLSGLRYARAEAIKCRGDVVFDITNENGWEFTVTSSECSDIRELKRKLQLGAADSATITFKPLGKSDCPQGGCAIAVGDRVINIYSSGYIGSS